MKTIADYPLWIVIVIWLLERTYVPTKAVFADPVCRLASMSSDLVSIETYDNPHSGCRQLLLSLISNYRHRVDAQYAILKNLNISVVGFIPKKSGE